MARDRSWDGQGKNIMPPLQYKAATIAATTIISCPSTDRKARLWVIFLTFRTETFLTKLHYKYIYYIYSSNDSKIKLEGHSVERMYLWQRPKSENLASLTNRSSATVRPTEKLTDLGNSLALGLQREVNSISLQCIPWPVAYAEWGACLTDFDRSSTFRFSGSGIRTMIRIGLKSWSVRPRPDTWRHAKFHPNSCTRFWVILLTDRQTDRHRGQSHIPPPLSEVDEINI